MKQTYKTLLLAVLILAAIGGVLFFVKTRVAPPMAIEAVDQFCEVIEAHTDSLKNAPSCIAMRPVFVELNDKVKRFREEGLLESRDANNYELNVNAIYAEALSDYGYRLYNAPTWNGATIEQMLEWAEELKAEKLPGGASAVPAGFGAKATELRGIYNDYLGAKSIVSQTYYTTPADIQSKISRSRSYAQNKYLQNNTELAKALSELPARLAKAHYDFIDKQISDKLDRFRSYSENYYYDNLVADVDSKLAEYKNAQNYGNDHDAKAKELENRAVAAIDRASKYYSYQ